MSQEAIEDAFDFEEEGVVEEQEVEEEQQEEQPKPSGYITKEDWVASGKPADEWVTEDVFKERTQRIKETSRLKRELAHKNEELDNRIKNLNALSQAQINRLQAQLEAERDRAIEVADKSEVKRLDKEINSLRSESELIAEKTPQQQQRDPAILEWEADNPWVNDPDDPRRSIAIDAFVKAQQAGKTMAGCLLAADKSVMNYEPKQERRKMAPMADMSKSSAPPKSGGVTLTWSQLKQDEVAYYDELFEPAGMSKKDFLKTVADQRKGA